MWGHGVYVHNDGTSFEGMWKAGKRKGLGTILFPNGDRYYVKFHRDFCNFFLELKENGKMMRY